MCGRFSLVANADDLAAVFGVSAQASIPARYNIAPTQPILAVRHSETGRKQLTALEWGLVPEWKKDRDPRRITKPLINARVETIEEKPSFRGPIKRTRCLIPFTGWYEWSGRPQLSDNTQVSSGKQSWLIAPKDTSIQAFAGIWTTWHGPAGDHWLETVAIVTSEASDNLSAVHHRKPLVVHPDSYQDWLRPHDPLPRNFWSSIRFQPEEFFIPRPVCKAVNSAHYDGPECHQSPPQQPESPTQGSLF